MAPSVATIGVTRLTFPVETAASQHRLGADDDQRPWPRPTPSRSAGASGRPVANAAGTRLHERAEEEVRGERRPRAVLAGGPRRGQRENPPQQRRGEAEAESAQ